MRKIRFIATMSVLLVFMTGGLHAQKTDDRILLNIAGEEVTAGDFMYVYKKNNINREDQGLDSISKYLQLYINFRLKVREAEELGLDTAKAFITELEGYRKQLAQPYFYDSTISEKLIREAYERKQWDLRASHILFTCDKNALPQDTLKAFHSAMAARNRVMAGEDFSKVSVELSQDPNARDSEASQYRPARKGNLGDLGYFTVFDMVYPFESAAYNTSVGT
ncbi:MAG: peptidylprolyl isomerase, partial [Bacteroidales bacterium]|nr:peptidylprolyl isomerase [Bacteroidales bacterium]